MKFKLQIMVLGISLLVIFSVFASYSKINQTNAYSDTFSTGTINSVWTQYNASGVGIIQSNGVLTAIEKSLGSTDLSSYIYKNVTTNINRVDVDYSFNFLNGMGKMYLIGHDSTGNKTTFAIGMNDGWSTFNAKPIIYIYESDGITPNASNSWHLPDSSTYTTMASGGTGHITVYFNTSTIITVEFTFPETYEYINNITQTFQLAGITGQIELDITFPPNPYYESGECFMFDNYAENGLIPATSMSSTCPGTTATSTFINPPSSSSTTTPSTSNTTSSKINTNSTFQNQTNTTSLFSSLLNHSINTNPGFEFPIMIFMLAIFVVRRKIKNK